MKITNKPFLRIIIRVLIGIIIITGSLSVTCWLMPNLFPAGMITFLIVVFSIAVFIYTQLRYIEFDSTGEVLILKIYHPLKDGKHLHKMRAVELPKQIIRKHFINTGFLYKELILLIENESHKPIKLKFNLSQMEMKTFRNIYQELDKPSK